MPQLNGADGDDLGANDELIAFKDEGEREEKRNVSAEGDLDDVKSSLVNESETNSSSDSEVSLTGHQKRQPLDQLFHPLPPHRGWTDSRVKPRHLRCSHFCFVFTFYVCRQTDVPNPIQIWGAGPDTISCSEKKVMHTVSTSVVLFCRNY